MSRPRKKRGFVDDFFRVSMRSLADQMRSRRKLLELDQVMIDTGNGPVLIDLVNAPASLGGSQKMMVCPLCKGNRRVLRVTPDAPYLLCNGCLRKKYKLNFLSQQRSAVMRGIKTDKGER